GDARVLPVDAVRRLRVPDRRAAVVPEAEARAGLAQHRQVRLGGAERRVVEDRTRQPHWLLDLTPEPVQAPDEVIIDKKLRPPADFQRSRRAERGGWYCLRASAKGDGAQEIAPVHGCFFPGGVWLTHGRRLW